MPPNKQKLELTWIGKENRPKLEPRILVEDPEKSYHANFRVRDWPQENAKNTKDSDSLRSLRSLRSFAANEVGDIFDNMLIFGDNLLALKALEQDYTGKVKCVYIDPPYNTGSAFAEYDDGIEHSLWLSLIRERLDILRRLISDHGSIWIQLDNNEAHYCKVLLDEVFGRSNFVANLIWQKSYAVRSHADFISTSHEHILVYAKNRNSLELNKFG